MELVANDDDTINEATTLTFNFAPLHNLPEDAEIVITVSDEYFDLSCDFEDFSGFDSDGPSCSYDSGDNAITLTNMFDEPDEDNGDYSYVYEDGSLLSITFESITMPDSAVSIEEVTVQTYWVNSGSSTRYSVDDYTEADSILTVQPDDFSSAFIDVSEEETYSDAFFTFEMTTTNAVPNDGKIRVLLPPELVVDDIDDIECSEFDENGENDEGLDDLECTAEELV